MKCVRWLGMVALMIATIAPWVQGAVVINELYYDAAGTDTDREFIELYNNGATAVNVSGWVIEYAGDSFSAPYGTVTLPTNTIIQPHDYLLVGGSLVQGDWGVLPDIIAATAYQNGGTESDGVRINNLLGYYDTILYDSPNANGLRGDDADPGAELCPDVASGHSLERVTLGVDNNLAADWFDNATPTPHRSSAQPGNNPPQLSGTAYYPIIVAPIDPVLVRSRASDDHHLVSVNIKYQYNGGGYLTISMYDDGLHGDGAAGDSIYGGNIPPRIVDDEVEFYVEAIDDSGAVTRDPAGAPGTVYGYTVRNVVLSTIAGVRPIDANGVALYQDSLVMVIGLVEAADNFGISGPAYIRDATGGIAVYGLDISQRHIAIGDSIKATGWVNSFNGLIEVDDEPLTGTPDPSIIIRNSGHPVNPVVVTIPQIGEAYEGQLIRINGGHFLTSGSFAYTNYPFVVGSDTTEVRIDNDCGIVGTPIPTGNVDVIGCLGQYDLTSPYFSGYQTLPRFVADIVSTGNQPPAISNVIRTPLLPTPTDSVWVTARMFDDHHLNNTSLWYQVNGGGWLRTQLPMLDDGLHHDGAAGDSTFGAGIPPRLNNDVVDYYISATDDSAATATNPAGAPTNHYTYTVSATTTITQISYVRQNDANGMPLRMDSLYTVVGLVTASTQFGTAGPAFLQDGTGGIGLYDTDGLAAYGIVAGDSVRLTGWVGFSNGLTEFVDDPNNAASNPVVTILNSGNILTPLVLNIPQAGENYEGQLVAINGARFVETGNFGTSGTYHIYRGTDTLAVYIDVDTGIGGSPIPTDAVNVMGNMSQYDITSPFTSGYQLMPRSIADIGAGTPQITPISYVRENDVNGSPIRLDSMFTIHALVTATTNFGASGPANLQDATGGIAFFDPTVTSSGIAIGDSIQITAWVGFYAGLTELVDHPVSGADPIIVRISTGNPVNPRLTTVAQFNESVEGQLIRIDGGHFIVTGNFAYLNYAFVVGSDTIQVRIDNDTDIIGTPIPNGTVNMVGVVSQYDATSPYTEGYQLMPRMLTDIIVPIIPRVDDMTVRINGDNVVLRWNVVTGAIDFKVYYSDTPSGPWTVLATSTGGARVYTHTGGAASPTVHRFYYVTAIH